MTAAQLAACRDNAHFSTGPRTPEGKKRSSLNSFRHGLTGHIVIHSPEDGAAFQKHCDAIREALAPIGALETDLAQAIAEDKWRLNRARALENSIFTLGLREHSNSGAGHPEVDAALAQGRTWIEQAKNLQLLTIYEQRIRRSVEKNMAELRVLQAERKAAIAQAEKEAHLLVQLAEYEAGHGHNFDPSNDFPPETQPLGFVFSKSKILRQIERERRLTRARALDLRAEFENPQRSATAQGANRPSALALCQTGTVVSMASGV